MAKKRKAPKAQQPDISNSKHDIDERFDDSEDDFFAGKEKILLDEAPAAKRRRRLVEQEKDLQASDEEVFNGAESESDGDNDYDINEEPHEDIGREDERESDEEDEEGANWGTTRADYYNADVIETEADALDEEREAQRLQQKQLKSMTNADFGFDEYAWTQSDQKENTEGPVVEKLPEVRIPQSASNDDKVDILYHRYPEFQLLGEDFCKLQEQWIELQRQCAATKSSLESGITSQTKLNAIAAYLGAIAMYFAVVSSTTNKDTGNSIITALSPAQLREHAVIQNLVSARKTWDMVKDVQIVVREKDPTPTVNGTKQQRISHANPKTIPKAPKVPLIVSKKHRKVEEDGDDKDSSSDSYDDDVIGNDSSLLPVLPAAEKQKRKPLDLQTLLAQPVAVDAEEGQEFGDEDPLTEKQAADKAKRKKSLRFYTSQIAQKANKRGAASRQAGGDDDVPRKERLREKQERLLKEAERRGNQKASAAEELDSHSDEDASGSPKDGYYASLVSQSKQKKAEKKAKADAYAEATRQGAQVHEEELIGTDGKRKITYAIEKNKGLAPKRKKDVRNPRVKKRKKYDEKMKKLGSIRQVYKGGEGRGGYGGELTGIKTNVVKSIKL